MPVFATTGGAQTNLNKTTPSQSVNIDIPLNSLHHRSPGDKDVDGEGERESSYYGGVKIQVCCMSPFYFLPLPGRMNGAVHS